ncbi:aldehyde dehydrogenase family protein [Streptomyces sp. NPDC026672]|uniref:aldehyde dehydrogenase family protein n=1 Tax=unclassified Streptomyces TaxID=2593676 RepID=UPI0033D817F0
MPETTQDIAAKQELFIAGTWIDARDHGTLTIVDPNTEEPVYTVPEATRADVDRAVAAAREVLESGSWEALGVEKRVAHLLRFADELERRAPEMTTQLAHEMGTPLSGAREVAGAIGLTRHFASVAGGVGFSERRAGAFRPSLVDRVPVGVVAAVVPWNAPVFLTVQKMVPALLAGCPVIVKPAPQTAYSAFGIAEAVAAAGLPAGTVSVLPADREVSEYLATHPGVDKVSFTGSTATGRRIMELAAGDIKRVGLELGGKSAGIVLPDADFAAVMPAVVGGTMCNSGQACTLLSRLLVPRERAEEFLTAYAAALDEIVVGPALDPASVLGPLVSRAQYEKVMGYIESGLDEGARLVRGGGRPAGQERGHFVEPTVFADVTPDMRIVREEIFGPVISVLTYDTLDEAVRIANDTPYGLSGAVFGPDTDAAVAVARRLRAGIITVNSAMDFDFDAPFGGFGASGTGRELGGADGILAFTEARTIGV